MPLHTYPIAPVIISDEPASMVAITTGVLSASTVYLYAFELQAPITIVAVKWGMGATVTGTTNIGIYTFAGNLVSGSDTGAKTNVASSDNSFTYASALALSPGQYLLALAPSNSTDTYMLRSAAQTTATNRARRATNALSAGALPATTGAFVTTGNFPACSLTVQGGL